MVQQIVNMILGTLMGVGIMVFIFALLFGGSTVTVNNTNSLYTTWTTFTGGVPQIVAILIALMIVVAAMAMYYAAQGGMFGGGKKGK